VTQEDSCRSGCATVQTDSEGQAAIAMRLRGSLETRWRATVDYDEARDLIRALAQWRAEHRRTRTPKAAKPVAPEVSERRYESGAIVLFETEDDLAEIGGDPDKVFIGGDPKESVAIFVSPSGAVELISALAQWLVARRR
jgi:hypothetical protein